ncbi:MAG: dephospho-CoA kinase [Lachnospiraceae bacterium]|nr:dephospho-CoA kinase [Lachnospiraceae bacterium]
MYVIGITGGVGAGKSQVLSILKETVDCEIIRADDVANELKLKGNPCYDKIVDLLGEGVLGADGEIDRSLMSMIVFEDEAKMKQVEMILHPQVKRYISEKIDEKRREGKIKYLFIEAALLIEDGYKQICDEFWYIHASVATRTKRLMESRGYTLQKIEQIMDKQLSEAEFRKNCECVIDNDGDLETTKQEIFNTLH